MAIIWIFSDPHFGHANILKFTWKSPNGETSVRPGFADVEEMNETIIQRINEVVLPHHHLYCLGDVAINKKFIPLAKRLNGHKRITLGNHDIYPYQEYAAAGFEKIMAYRVMDGVVLSHVPIHPANMGRFSGNIHGHMHQNPHLPGPYLNVCVEQTDYRPVLLSDAKKQLLAKIENETGL